VFKGLYQREDGFRREAGLDFKAAAMNRPRYPVQEAGLRGIYSEYASNHGEGLRIHCPERNHHQSPGEKPR
jgi:hypothetical protein